MSKALTFSVIVLCLLLVLTSCIPKVSSDDEPPGESDCKPPEGKVFLKADISKVLSRSPSFSQGIEGVSKTDSAEWYVIYENVTEGSGISYETLDSTEVTLTLEKGSIYVVGLAKENDSGWIEVVGVLGDPYLGVACIPVSDEATEVIDLGRLIEDEGILRSETMTPEEFSEMLGFSKEMLKEFGKSDVTFKNFLNPDINRNGVIDSEEGLIWWITSLYDFKVDVTAGKPYLEGFVYVFWMNREYILRTYGEEFAVNSINSDIFNNDKDIAKLTNLDTSESLEPDFVHVEFDDYYQWYFRSDSPEDGDYRLDAVGSDTRNTYSFYFEDLRFFNPMRDFEGLITPIYETQVYSDGKVKSLSWDWKIHTAGGMKDVSEDIVRLFSQNGIFMWFYFATKAQFFSGETGPNTFITFTPQESIPDPYNDQIVDLESLDYWVYPTPWEAVEIGGDYLMVGNTDAAFHKECNYIKEPHDFDPDDEGMPPTLEDMDGTWYNLYYHSQNWDRYDTALDKGDKWASIKFDTDSGKFEAAWLFTFKTDFDPHVASTGTFEISEVDPHVIILKPVDGEPLYMYVEVHDTYFEAMISESTPTEIARESENYMIYSRYSMDASIEDSNPQLLRKIMKGHGYMMEITLLKEFRRR